jgi:hypothetical protein
MQNICSVEVIFIMMHGMTMLAIGRNKGGLYETTNTNTISWNDTVKVFFLLIGRIYKILSLLDRE